MLEIKSIRLYVFALFLFANQVSPQTSYNKFSRKKARLKKNGDKIERKLQANNGNEFWSPFGESIHGTFNGIESGRFVSVTSNGKLMVVGSLYSVVLYEYDRGWRLVVDFLEQLDAISVGPYTVVISEDGNHIGIGSFKSRMKGFNTGSVQFFERGNNLQTWSQMGRLLAGANRNDKFGFSLDLSDDGSRALIGAYGANSVYIYDYRESRQLWTIERILSSGLDREGYGYAVAVSGAGDRAIVGAPFANEQTGYARIHDIETFQFVHQIDGDIMGAQYGSAVAMAQNGMVATLGAPVAGHVFVSQYFEEEVRWGKLGFRINMDDEFFGSSLSLSSDGRMIAIGAPYNSFFGPLAGHTYVFQYDELDNAWGQIGEDFYGLKGFDYCGMNVALSSDSKKLVVACPGGDGEDGRTLDSGRVDVYRSPITFDDDDFISPSTEPTSLPSMSPFTMPSMMPSDTPTKNPTMSPTKNPTITPTKSPTKSPTETPTMTRTNSPTMNSTGTPTMTPTNSPTMNSTDTPTMNPTNSPTRNSTDTPTMTPTNSPTMNSTDTPSMNPTNIPSMNRNTNSTSSTSSGQNTTSNREIPPWAGGIGLATNTGTTDKEMNINSMNSYILPFGALLGIILSYFGGLCTGFM